LTGPTHFFHTDVDTSGFEGGAQLALTYGGVTDQLYFGLEATLGLGLLNTSEDPGNIYRVTDLGGSRSNDFSIDVNKTALKQTYSADLALKLGTPINQYNMLYFLAGGGLSKVCSETDFFPTNSAPDFESKSSLVTVDLNKLERNILLGVGLQHAFSHHVSLGLTYQYLFLPKLSTELTVIRNNLNGSPLVTHYRVDVDPSVQKVVLSLNYLL
jgi:opacity protein-like surface antigen